jgi:hypothetical protein
MMDFLKTLSFNTGKTPGNPMQTGQTFVFGEFPNFVEQLQNIFVSVFNCACTSKPMTASNSIMITP